jgi:hypothetical protein
MGISLKSFDTNVMCGFRADGEPEPDAVGIRSGSFVGRLFPPARDADRRHRGTPHPDARGVPIVRLSRRIFRAGLRVMPNPLWGNGLGHAHGAHTAGVLRDRGAETTLCAFDSALPVLQNASIPRSLHHAVRTGYRPIAASSVMNHRKACVSTSNFTTVPRSRRGDRRGAARKTPAAP